MRTRERGSIGVTSRLDWAVFVALGFMWGSSYLFIKLAVDDFGTFTLVALRLAVGAALLWTIFLFSRKTLPRSARTYGHLAVMGALNIAIPFALITWAERDTSSALAAILTSLVPLFAAVLAPAFLPDEPLRINAIGGLGIGFAGVVVLTGGGGDATQLLAAIALVLSALSYGAGAVYARRNVRGLDPMVPAVLQVTIAGIYTAAIALAFERPWLARPDGEAVFSIVWLGILGSGFAYLAAFRLLQRWGATRMTAVAYLIPVFGVALGWLVLREPIGANTLVGTALILAGIGLVNSRYGRRILIGSPASARA
jgi:drug/metabolite transporter (DMT)-like permease